VSTRLIGALIMTHSDDNGLVLPPNLAPTQVVIVPIYKKEDQLAALMEKLNPIADELKALGIRVKVDTDDKYTPGYKFADYELKGVPVRLAMGGRDLENGTIEIARRDTMEKETVSLEGIVSRIQKMLEDIQQNIYQKALDFRIANTREVNSYDEFKEEVKKGGFILAHWDGTPETEEQIKADTKATIRCIPLADLPGHHSEPGTCMVTGKPSAGRVVFALSY
jgi:prolyl-tRNA synthetase